MKRSDKTILFAGLSLPVLFAIPIILSLFFLHATVWFYSLSFLFLLYIVIVIALPLGSERIKSSYQKSPSPLKSFFHIIFIQLLTLSLFLGQILTFTQYKIDARHQTALPLAKWFYLVSLHTFSNIGLFPWAMVIAISIFFHLAAKQSQKPYAIIESLKLPKHRFESLTRRVIDLYFTQAGRCLFAFCLGMIALQISLIIYPSQSALFYPILGATTCCLLVALSNYKPLVSILNAMETKKIPPMFFIIFQTLVLAALFILAGFVSTFLLKQHGATINEFRSMNFFHNQNLAYVDPAWSFIWWILAAPLVGSLIHHYSNGLRVRTMILLNLILPIAMGLLLLTAHHVVLAKPLPTMVITLFQLAGLLGLILLFSTRQSHEILWLGYIPSNKMKKLRATKLRLLWMLPAGFMGIFALSGMQGLLLIASIAAIPLLCFYLVLIRLN